LNRRRFLKLSLAGAAAGVPLMSYRGRAQAAPFGEFPADALSVLLPPERRAKRVLEIFLYGGLSPWETMYCVPAYGRPDDPEFPNQQLHAFLGGGQHSVEAALEACQFPDSVELSTVFDTDLLGAHVGLGPFAHQLNNRPDITARMRLCVTTHRLEPHEGAVPLVLTGRPVGQPAAAGLGTHIQRYFADHFSSGRAAPFSYLFATGGISSDNVSAAAATGLHPGYARPLKITITNAAQFARLLNREQIGNVTDPKLYDELMQRYVEEYRARLRFPGRSDVARSRRFNDLALAANTVGNVEAIRAVLSEEVFATRPGETCGIERDIDIPGMSLEAARHLLTHPTEPARYVCVSDIGLFEASGGGGYDTHTRNSRDTSRNFNNLLKNLLAIINAPGETDPKKLNLDDTLIILNTEFGRTPFPQGGGSGRNHWPYAYVTTLIGGPITKKERGIEGAIGPDGLARQAITPAQHRMAALLALGIWPFSSESFAVSDSPGAVSEIEAAQFATARVLGIKV
jgi:hypothetical protein